jgi:hypothetical protein
MNRRAAEGVFVGAVAVAGGVAAHRWFERGPSSFRAEFARSSAHQLAEPFERDLITEDDLSSLPPPVASYLRATGAVGQPHIGNFHATIRGRIRSGPDHPWMPFTGEQVNRYGPEPSRLFHIVASMRGVPTDVYHDFVGVDATMRVKVLSAFTIVNARGPEMNRSETVTIFNDMCVLAPAALVDAAIEWETIDERAVRGTFTRLGETVAATLVFGDDGLLIDFTSDDRFRSSSDGTTFERQRWSTPLSRYQPMDGRLIGTHGEGRWHSDSPDSSFAYLEFELDDIEFNAVPPR